METKNLHLLEFIGNGPEIRTGRDLRNYMQRNKEKLLSKIPPSDHILRLKIKIVCINAFREW